MLISNPVDEGANVSSKTTYLIVRVEAFGEYAHQCMNSPEQSSRKTWNFFLCLQITCGSPVTSVNKISKVRVFNCRFW